MTEDNRELDLEKEIKARGNVSRFFISGWTNIVRLMGANALFIIFNIPAIAITYCYSLLFLPVLIPAFNLEKFITVTEADGSPVISSTTSASILAMSATSAFMANKTQRNM